MSPQPFATTSPVDVDPQELPDLSARALCVARDSVPMAAPTARAVSLEKDAPRATPMG